MNLVEAIQNESNRLREQVLPEYDKIPAGVFAATAMRLAIKAGEQAIASGDAMACVQALKDLQGFEL